MLRVIRLRLSYAGGLWVTRIEMIEEEKKKRRMRMSSFPSSMAK